MAGTLRLPLLVVLALALAHAAAAQQQPANTTGEPSLSPVNPINNGSTVVSNATVPAANTTVNTTTNSTAPVDPLANITAPINVTADALLIRTVLPESRRFGETADEPTQAEFRKAQLARLVTLFGRLLEAQQRKLQRTRADIFDSSIRRTAAEQQANAYDAETAATLTAMRKLQGRIERQLVKLQGWALRNLRRQAQEAVTASFTARTNTTTDARVLRLSRAHVRHADWNVLNAYQYLRQTLKRIYNRELLREAGKAPTEAELMALFKDIAEARNRFQANRGFLANARDNVFEARERLNWHDSSLATYTNLLNQTRTLTERMKKFLAYHQAYYKSPPPEPEPQQVDVHVQAHVLVGPDGKTTVRLENSNAPKCVDSDGDGICDSRRVGPFKVTDQGKLIDARKINEVRNLTNAQQMEAGKAIRTVVVAPALADESHHIVRPTAAHANGEFLPPIPPRPTLFNPNVLPPATTSRQHNDFDPSCTPGSKWYPTCRVQTKATVHVDIDANGVPTITTLLPTEQTFRPRSRDPAAPVPPEDDPEIKSMVEHITQMERMSEDVAKLAKLLEQQTNTTNTILLQVDEQEAPLSPNGQSGVPVTNSTTANATAYTTPAPSASPAGVSTPVGPLNDDFDPHAETPDQPIVKQNQNYSYTSIAATTPEQLLSAYNSPTVNNTNVSALAPVPMPSLFPHSGFMEDELDAEEVDRELAFDAAMAAKFGAAAPANPTAPEGPTPPRSDETLVHGVVAGNWRVPITVATPPSAPEPPNTDPIKTNASDGAPQVFGAPEAESGDRTLDKQDRVQRREFKPLQISYTDSELDSIVSWEKELGIPPPPPPPTFGAMPPAPSMPTLPPPPNWNGSTYDDSWLQGPPPVKHPASHPSPSTPNPSTPITQPPTPPTPPVLPPPANITKHFIPPSLDNSTDPNAVNQTFQHVWEEDTSNVDTGKDDEPGAQKPPVWQTKPKAGNGTNTTEMPPKKDYSSATQLTKPYLVSPSDIKRIDTNPADHALSNFTRVVTTTTVYVKPQEANDLIHKRDGQQMLNTSLVHTNTQENDTSQTAANQPGNAGHTVDGRNVPGVTWPSKNKTDNATAGNTTVPDSNVTNATVPKPPHVVPNGYPARVPPRLPYGTNDNTTVNSQIPTPPRPGKKDPASVDVLTVHSEPKGSNISVPTHPQANHTVPVPSPPVPPTTTNSTNTTAPPSPPEPPGRIKPALKRAPIPLDITTDHVFSNVKTTNYDPVPPSSPGDDKPFPNEPVCIACLLAVPPCPACGLHQVCHIEPQTCLSCAHAVCVDAPVTPAPTVPTTPSTPDPSQPAPASNGVRYITPLPLVTPVIAGASSSSSSGSSYASSSSSESSLSSSSKSESSLSSSFGGSSSSVALSQSAGSSGSSSSRSSESSLRSSSSLSESSFGSGSSSSSSGSESSVMHLSALFGSSSSSSQKSSSESSSESSLASQNRQSSESSSASAESSAAAPTPTPTPSTTEKVEAEAEHVEKLPAQYPTASTLNQKVSVGEPFAGAKGTTDPVEAEADAVDALKPVSPAPAAPKLITFSSPKSGATDVVRENYPSTIIIPQPNARFMETDAPEAETGSHRLRSLLYRRRGRLLA